MRIDLYGYISIKQLISLLYNYFAQIQQMKPSAMNYQQRNQYLQLQKASFISHRPYNTHGSVQQKQELSIKRTNPHQNRISEKRIPQIKKQPEFLNIFEDDDQCLPITKLNSCVSSDDLRISFKNSDWEKPKKPTKPLKYDQSNQQSKFPIKCVSQRNLHLSGSLQKEDSGEFLVIKSGKSIQEEVVQTYQQEGTKRLLEQIQKVEKQNKNIKQQNLQLRLKKIKLTSNSDTMTMLTLKTEIQNLKKAIANLKGSYYGGQGETNSISSPTSTTNRVSLGIQSDLKFLGTSQALKDSITLQQGNYITRKSATPKLKYNKPDLTNNKVGSTSYIFKTYEPAKGQN